MRPRDVVTALAIAIGTLIYVWALISSADALRWWGAELAPTAIAYLPTALLPLALAGRRWRGVLGLSAAMWAGCTLVSWLPRQSPIPADGDRFGYLVWWSVLTIAVYVIVPVGYARIAGDSVRSYGLSLGRLRDEVRVLPLVFGGVVLAAWFVSDQPRFTATYPFLRSDLASAGQWGRLLVFEALYGLTFVALEFFYRGFLVNVGFRTLGWTAVPVMAAPYCLLHIGKPGLEVVASLFGGILLGYLSLHFRSIAIGVVAHLALAWGTDSAVLLRR